MNTPINPKNPVFDQVIGHEQQCDYLRRVIETGQIAHAYCFFGAKSLGKATMAKAFAAELLGVEVQRLQTSPNVTIVSDQDGKISVEQIRDLKQTLSLSTLGGGWKVSIIDGADNMTTAAQNALLKTLEEPTAQTLIILVAHHPDALLETIRSRSVMIGFHLLPVQSIEHVLMDQLSFAKDRAERLAQLSMGRPGVALMCSDEDYCLQLEDDAQKTLHFLEAPLYERMRMIEVVTKQKEDRQRTIQNMIELWRMWLHVVMNTQLGLCASSDVQQLTSRYSVDQIRKALSTLHDCEFALDHNVQPALALQVFATSLN